jgi:hypothetical protein
MAPIILAPGTKKVQTSSSTKATKVPILTSQTNIDQQNQNGRQ